MKIEQLSETANMLKYAKKSNPMQLCITTEIYALMQKNMQMQKIRALVITFHFRDFK